MAHFVIPTIILPGERAHAPLDTSHIHTHIQMDDVVSRADVNYDFAMPHKRKIMTTLTKDA